MSGNGFVTGDGCPVEVYAELPTFGEPEWIHSTMADGGSVLDLGAGVGRLADPLVALGHRVLALDDSIEMLAHVRSADTLVGRIESLSISERFDAVVLASHLVNTRDAVLRRAFLAAVQRHMKADGLAFVEWHEPEWFDQVAPGRYPAGQLGPVTSALTVDAYDGLTLHASVEYELRGSRWVQPFAAERLSAQDLAEAFAQVGLRRTTIGVPRPGWVIAETASD